MNDIDHEQEYSRRWEDEASFNDVLAEQIRKAPYALISIAVHAVLAFIISGWIILTSTTSEAPTITVQAPPPPPDIEEEEPPEEEIVEEIVEEPVLQENEIEEVVEQETLEDEGDPDFNSDAPFDADSWNNDVGLGGGAGGKYGKRGGMGGRKGGNATEKAVLSALKWLADHQTTEGFWDCDEFPLEDKYPNEPPSTGPGNPVNDVGVTGLALLAFLGNGNTMSEGQYRENVSRGINWLKRVQLETGLFGDDIGNPTLYNHSIATMAMGEAYYFANRTPLLRKNMTKAVSLISRSRNPYGVWRYAVEPNGDNDSSITGWMIFALKTAQDGKIPVSKDNFDGAKSWFAQMTDPGNGRTGYDYKFGRGSAPARPEGYKDRWPGSKSESLTAVALLCSIFMADSTKIRSNKDYEDYEILKKQADLCVRTLPVWDDPGGSIDMYYWYYATFAMYQWGGNHWKQWQKAIEKALIPNQCIESTGYKKDDNLYGSWDPIGPWGEGEGGRVYSTATGALILEVYYRYARVAGAR
jgi:hypothetical protein